MAQMPKLLHDILTGKDNKTYESNRCIFAYLQFLITLWVFASLITKHSFDLLMLAQAEGILAVAFPIGVKIKDMTEPEFSQPGKRFEERPCEQP